jgi:hypothetical protein
MRIATIAQSNHLRKCRNSFVICVDRRNDAKKSTRTQKSPACCQKRNCGAEKFEEQQDAGSRREGRGNKRASERMNENIFHVLPACRSQQVAAAARTQPASQGIACCSWKLERTSCDLDFCFAFALRRVAASKRQKLQSNN